MQTSFYCCESNLHPGESTMLAKRTPFTANMPLSMAGGATLIFYLGFACVLTIFVCFLSQPRKRTPSLPSLASTDAHHTASAASSNVARERQFICILPELQRASVLRSDACRDSLLRIRSSLVELSHQPIPDAFVDEVTSLASKWQWAEDAAEHQRWLSGKFEEMVISVNDIELIIQREFGVLNQSLSEIDDRLLVSLRLDVAVDPNSVVVPAVDLNDVNRHVISSASSLRQSVTLSLQEDFATTLGSLAVGELTSAAALAGMAYATGDVNDMQRVSAAAIGIGAGYVADNLISGFMGTRESIISCCRDSRFALIKDIVLVSEPGKELFCEARRLQETHAMAVHSAIFNSLEVDSRWANRLLEAYIIAADGGNDEN